MVRATMKLMVMSVLATMAVAAGGCSTEKAVTTYVAGYNGVDAESREKFAQLQEAGRVDLIDDIETEQIVDYVVLPPMPGDAPRADASETDPPAEVLDQTHWFAATGAQSRAQEVAREREIPVVELSRFFELAENGELVRRERPSSWRLPMQ